MQQAIVFAHGIWMKGYEMALLRKRMAAQGYTCHQFRYASLFASPAENAVALNRFMQKIDADIIHIVAHSLGGIIVAHLFEAYPYQKPGRIVLLGSPLRGSVVARRLHASVLTRGFVGQSVQRGLLGNAPHLKCQREVGMIAGTRGIGMGTLVMFGKLPKPNDGTVVVSETDVPNLTEHFQVPYSHFTMLIAKPVAQAVASFLKHGLFSAAQ